MKAMSSLQNNVFWQTFLLRTPISQYPIPTTLGEAGHNPRTCPEDYVSLHHQQPPYRLWRDFMYLTSTVRTYRNLSDGLLS